MDVMIERCLDNCPNTESLSKLLFSDGVHHSYDRYKREITITVSNSDIVIDCLWEDELHNREFRWRLKTFDVVCSGSFNSYYCFKDSSQQTTRLVLDGSDGTCMIDFPNTIDELLEVGSVVLVEGNGEQYEAVIKKLNDDDTVVVESEMTGKVYTVHKDQLFPAMEKTTDEQL